MCCSACVPSFMLLFRRPSSASGSHQWTSSLLSLCVLVFVGWVWLERVLPMLYALDSDRHTPPYPVLLRWGHVLLSLFLMAQVASQYVHTAFSEPGKTTATTNTAGAQQQESALDEECCCVQHLSLLSH